MSDPQLRTVEAILCWEEGNWTTEPVEVSANTIEYALEAAVRRAVYSRNQDPSPVYVGLFNETYDRE